MKNGGPDYSNPADPSAPGRLPKSTRHIQTSYRKTTEGSLPACVPHYSPGKFATVTSGGTRVEENSEKGDLQEWNFKKR